MCGWCGRGKGSGDKCHSISFRVRVTHRDPRRLSSFSDTFDLAISRWNLLPALLGRVPSSWRGECEISRCRLVDWVYLALGPIQPFSWMVALPKTSSISPLRINLVERFPCGLRLPKCSDNPEFIDDIYRSGRYFPYVALCGGSPFALHLPRVSSWRHSARWEVEGVAGDYHSTPLLLTISRRESVDVAGLNDCSFLTNPALASTTVCSIKAVKTVLGGCKTVLYVLMRISSSTNTS